MIEGPVFWVNWLKWFYPMMSPALPRRDHKVVLITNYWTSAHILIFLSLTAGLGLCQQFASVFKYGWMSFIFFVLSKYQQISNKTFTLCTSFGSQLNLFLCVCVWVCVCVCVSLCSGWFSPSFSRRDTGDMLPLQVSEIPCVYECKLVKSKNIHWTA